jgi:hypothetical protein
VIDNDAFTPERKRDSAISEALPVLRVYLQYLFLYSSVFVRKGCSLEMIVICRTGQLRNVEEYTEFMLVP